MTAYILMEDVSSTYYLSFDQGQFYKEIFENLLDIFSLHWKTIWYKKKRKLQFDIRQILLWWI